MCLNKSIPSAKHGKSSRSISRIFAIFFFSFVVIKNIKSVGKVFLNEVLINF